MSNLKATNWEELAATSHYQTAVAVEEALHRGELSEAASGIQELIDALSRSEKRALKSYLIVLMTHVIKWHSQPGRRSASWRATIQNSRSEILDIQEETPSLNRAAVEKIWSKCFVAARLNAESEMKLPTSLASLTWEDVFEAPYEL